MHSGKATTYGKCVMLKCLVELEDVNKEDNTKLFHFVAETATCSRQDDCHSYDSYLHDQ